MTTLVPLTKLKPILNTIKNRRVQEGLLLSASVASLVATGDYSDPSRIDYNLAGDGKLEQGSTISVVLQKPDHFKTSPGYYEYYEPGYADTALDHFYQWTFRDGHGGLERFKTTNNSITLTHDQVGKTLDVTYSDFQGQGTIEYVGYVANVNDAPAGNVTIGTSIEARQKLTADTSKLVDIDGLGTLHYRWKVGGVNVGTDAKTYVTTTADIGKTVSVDVSYTDLGGDFEGAVGTAELVSSNIISKVLAPANAAPVFASNSTLKISVFENSNSSITVTATDADSPTLAYSLTGVDKDLFNIDSNGIVTFKSAPDFEAPKDNGADNVYNITVSAADEVGPVTRDVEITVTDIAPPSFSSTPREVTFYENKTSVVSISPTNPSNQPLTYSLTGADKDLFSIDASGAITFKSAPDFETPLDAGANNIYNITTNAANSEGSASQDVIVNVRNLGEPIISAPANFDPSGAEFLVNTLTAGDQNKTSITTLKNGGFVITWVSADPQDGDNSSSGIKAQIFDATGKPIGNEFLVNGETAAGQASADVTGLTNGNFVVTWHSADQQDTDKNGNAIKARIFDATGTQVKAEFQVNTRADNDQNEPHITALTGGGFVITWYSYDVQDADTTGTAVKAQVYNAAGTEVNGELLVNSHHTGDQNEPTIAALSNGGFVIVWHSTDQQDADKSATAIKAQLYNAAGAKVDGEFLVNSNHQQGQGDAHVSGLNNGGFVITWDSYDAQDADTLFNSIKAQIFDADGAPSGVEFLVNSRYTDFQFNPVVTTLKNGDFVITWHSDDKQDADTSGLAIKAQLFSPTGTKLGNEFLINRQHANDQSHPTIAALDDGGFVVTWQSSDLNSGDTSNGGIKAQIFKLENSHTYDAGQATDFIINTTFDDGAQFGTLSDVIISNVPTEATFSQGTNNNDGTWTITQSQLEDLQITFTTGFNGQATLELASTASASGTSTNTTTISVPITVGNLITGSGPKTATSGIDHVKLASTVDTLTEAGNKADYTFSVVGDNLQLIHKATGATNADLLNSVENIAFDDQTIDVKNLPSTGDLIYSDTDVFTHWLSHNYEYDTV